MSGRTKVLAPTFTRTIAALLCASLACTSAEPPPAPPAATSTALVLRNLTLIDGNGGAPVANSAIVIDEGRIMAVGPASEIQTPAGATVQDLTGRFVVPGIINLHAHVAASDGITQDPKTLFTRENVAAHLALYASYGVTAVASMGTDQSVVYEIREEQRRGRPAAARIFTAGRNARQDARDPSDRSRSCAMQPRAGAGNTSRRLSGSRVAYACCHFEPIV